MKSNLIAPYYIKKYAVILTHAQKFDTSLYFVLRNGKIYEISLDLESIKEAH